MSKISSLQDVNMSNTTKEIDKMAKLQSGIFSSFFQKLFMLLVATATFVFMFMFVWIFPNKVIVTASE